MPTELTCESCQYHVPTVPGHGECRVSPPSIPKHMAAGFVMVYGITEDSLGACGEYKPRPKPEPTPAPAPVLETKPAPAPEVKAEPKPAPQPEPRKAEEPRRPQPDQRRRTGR